MSDQPEQRQQSDQPDDSEPTPERQAELRAAHEANVAAGKAPYEGVHIRTRGELKWVMHEHGWVTQPDSLVRSRRRPDLRGTVFYGANLSGAEFYGANLSGADFEGAPRLKRVLAQGAALSGADVEGGADLGDAKLNGANLSGANLPAANLSGADLGLANLSGAELRLANLSGADLRSASMDASTRLAGIAIDTETRLGDVVWNGVPLTVVDWTQARRLGDERVRRSGDEQNIAKATFSRAYIIPYRAAVRAYRQLATILRTQGLNEDADRYAERAQVLQRRMRWHERQWPRWFGSLVLALIAGYGYKPARSVITYIVVNSLFAAVYAVLAYFGLSKEQFASWDSPLVLSVTSFHGRVFFASGLPLTDWAARVGAMEAVVGLFIEITFIATFTRRFFER